jgi:hypothetical protein
VTVTKYVDPVMTDGATAVIEVALITLTWVPASTTLSLVGVVPFSSTKFTVAPLVNPVPLIVTAVPPMIDPVEGLMPETDGTSGDQSQLSTVSPVPQYTTHSAVVGALTTPVG